MTYFDSINDRPIIPLGSLIFQCTTETTESNKSVTFPSYLDIESNYTFKINFQNGYNTTSASAMTLNGKLVKVVDEGTLKNLPSHNINNSYKYLDPNTVLELYYNGTDFVVIGNPIVLKSSTYVVYADGHTSVDETYPKDSTYVQYPWGNSPVDMWGDVSSWSNIEYGGAMFKARGSTALPFTRGLKLTNNPKGTTKLYLDSADANTMTDQSSLLNSGFSLSQMIVVFQVHHYTISSWSNNTITLNSNFLDNITPSTHRIFIGQMEGLPNIEGEFGRIPTYYNGYTHNGVFTSSYATNTDMGGGGGATQQGQIKFNANNGNSIFGRYNNVIPNNITIQMWKRNS